MITPHTFVDTRPLPETLLEEMDMKGDQDVFQRFYFPECALELDYATTLAHRYVCDASFLTSTGKFIQEWCKDPSVCGENGENAQTPPYTALQERDDARQDFHDTYQFFSIPQDILSTLTPYQSRLPVLKSSLASLLSLHSLNHHPWFMRAWACYTLGSPAMALLTPIFFMILPFFLLKLMRIPITISNYINYLKKACSGHAIGKLFQLQGSSIPQKIYILISIGFYGMNMVRNVYDCIRFVKQQPAIVETIRTTTQDIAWIRTRVLSVLSRLSRIASPHPAYEKYSAYLTDTYSRIEEYKTYLETTLDKLGTSRYPTFWTVGHSLSTFYRIHEDETIHRLYDDMVNFLGYYQVVLHVVSWCTEHETTLVEWSTREKGEKRENTPWTVDQFSPIVMLDTDTSGSTVKNTVDMSMNWMITGPNASGKTTVLRSMLWNQILAQQWGIMYAKRACVPIVDYFHCYLNVPDTYSRDSLFQAEARRCLEVLTFLDDHPDDTHFCIFDELYSGTNPVEATCGSIAYIQELQRRPHVRFMMTTHYHDVVKYSKSIHKAYMLLDKNSEYTYRLCDGVKREYGAVKVFKELGYSDTFVKRITRYIQKIGYGQKRQ